MRIILLVALAMRLYSLTGFSLSNDELSALSRLQFSGFSEIMEKGVIPDFHPAGVQLFLYYWIKVFGFSEFAVRFPFAIMGVVSVLLLFRIGKSWFGESTGLLAASALAILEFPLLYSQIARPYSPGLMCGLAAVFFWTRFLGVARNGDADLNRRGALKDGIGFALSVSACMYTHYFAFIFAGLVCLAGLFFVKRD
ncbi:MAG: glycosyltransferase family 39 protein, partial [Bacteroidota bacterium]